MDEEGNFQSSSKGNTVTVVGATTDAEVTNANTSGVQNIHTFIQGNVILKEKEETSLKKHASDGTSILDRKRQCQRVFSDQISAETDSIGRYEGKFRRNLEAKDKNSLISSELNEELEDSLGLQPLPEGKSYHAFFSHSSENTEWVEDVIAYLESQELGFRCVHHQRDFHAGVRVMDNISRFVSLSWKYVLILTPAFMRSSWCKFERDVMMKFTTDERQDRIVPVLLETCDLPLSLSFITYVDARSDTKWKDKLVRALRRPDSLLKNTTRSSGELPLSNEKLAQLFDGCRDQRRKYQRVIDQYKQDKRNLEAEKKTLEAQVNNAFDICINHMLDMMEKLRQKRIEDVHIQADSRIATLVQKRNAAQKILSSLKTDIKKDTQALQSFAGVLDEHMYLERRQREISYTEFVKSNALVDKMTELISEFDVGHLREMDITQVKTQEDRVSFLKAIEPSWAILPLSRDLTPWSLVRCPYFQFDPMTVRGDRSILPDGSLYNKPPSRPHPPSDRRLRKYYGAVGTTRLTSGSIYYWQNHVDVNLEKELETTNLVFEVGLSTHGVYDETHTTAKTTAKTTGTLCLCVVGCTEHTSDSVCMRVYKHDVRINHQTLLPKKTGQWPPLVLGFLLDTIRRRWTIYDVTKEEEITTVEDISVVVEFTPMFGVYARQYGSIKLSLTTGRDLKISDGMYNLIERALD